MKVKLAWLLALLFLLVMGGERTGSEQVGGMRTADVLSIDYTADRPSDYSTDIYSGTEGGTTVYIYGSGFDATASNNQVKFGDAPCIVKDGGATNNVLTCITTKPLPSQYFNPVMNVTVGKRTVSCTTGYLYQYSHLSPIIIRLNPRSPFAGQLVSFVGHHAVEYVDNISQLHIGEYLCSTFNITQTDQIYFSESVMHCQVDPLQPAGFYNFSELTIYGYSKHIPQSMITSPVKNFTYQVLLLPAVKGISENVGSSEAHKLTIYGSGFGNIKNSVDVRVAGVNCPVIEVLPNSVTCVARPSNSDSNILPNSGRLPTDTTRTQINGYVSGTGVSFRRYSRGELLVDGTVQGFIDGINSGLLLMEEEGVLPDLELNGTNLYHTYLFKGYFKAPRTGQYTFRVYSNDRVFMFLSPFKGSAEVNYSNPIISHNSSTSYGGSTINMFLNDLPANLTSPPVAMTAGDHYYFELIYSVSNYGSFMKSSVEIPNNDTSLFLNTRPEVQNISIQAQV
jgi:hypothetical protein